MNLPDDPDPSLQQFWREMDAPSETNWGRQLLFMTMTMLFLMVIGLLVWLYLQRPPEQALVVEPYSRPIKQVPLESNAEPDLPILNLNNSWPRDARRQSVADEGAGDRLAAEFQPKFRSTVASDTRKDDVMPDLLAVGDTARRLLDVASTLPASQRQSVTSVFAPEKKSEIKIILDPPVTASPRAEAAQLQRLQAKILQDMQKVTYKDDPKPMLQNTLAKPFSDQTQDVAATEVQLPIVKPMPIDNILESIDKVVYALVEPRQRSVALVNAASSGQGVVAVPALPKLWRGRNEAGSQDTASVTKSVSDKKLITQVQIASRRDRQQVVRIVAQLMQNFADALQGKQMQISRVDIPESGVFHRLMIQGFTGRIEADRWCEDWKRKSGDCLVLQHIVKQ